jgi:predicted nucleic acid-binding Zn ribbon protein
MDLRELRRLEAIRREDRRRARSKAQARREAIPPTLGELVTSVLAKSPEARRKLLEHRVLAAWPDIVGHPAAARARPVAVKGQTLTVHVDDPLWLQELLFLKAELLVRYRKALPDFSLTDIFFIAPTGGARFGRRPLR